MIKKKKDLTLSDSGEILSSVGDLCKQFRPRSGSRERSGSMVECLTRDRGVAGSSLTGVTALWSLSKTHLS